MSLQEQSLLKQLQDFGLNSLDWKIQKKDGNEFILIHLDNPWMRLKGITKRSDQTEASWEELEMQFAI
jgi:hypothetical protein